MWGPENWRTIVPDLCNYFGMPIYGAGQETTMGRQTGIRI